MESDSKGTKENPVPFGKQRKQERNAHTITTTNQRDNVKCTSATTMKHNATWGKTTTTIVLYCLFVTVLERILFVQGH
jgi:hypothetical protein